jgi:zinc protease
MAAPTARAAAEVQRVVSPGGIEAWLVESHEVSVIALEFAFDGGIELDPEGKEGLANLVSVTLDEGAGEMDSAAFQQALADSGVRLSFDAGIDSFRGSVKTVSDNAETAWDLLHLALTEPRFDEGPVERMRAAVFASIRRNVADPGWLSRRAFYDATFGDHPYGQPSRGTGESLAAITPDDLHGFVEDRFTRDALTVGVTGAITPEELGPLLDRLFGDLPAEGERAVIEDVALGAAGETILVERDGAQSMLMLGQPGVARDAAEWYDAVVLNSILGGGVFTSRLGMELREKRGLTYGIYSRLSALDHAQLWLVLGSLSNANVAPALEQIDAIWRDLAENGVTRDELDDAKTYLTGSFPLDLTSTDRIASILVSMQRENLGIDYLDQRNAAIEAVTLESVNALAARLLDADALTTVVVGNPPAGTLDPDRTRTAAEIAANELDPGT